MYKTASVATVRITINMAGSVDTARETCRQFCFDEKWCVTVKECDYVYTGGMESGFEIGIVNYPRFPSTYEELHEKAERLAVRLMAACCQWSALIVDASGTKWLSRKPEHMEEH